MTLTFSTVLSMSVGGSENVQICADVIYEWSLRKSSHVCHKACPCTKDHFMVGLKIGKKLGKAILTNKIKKVRVCHKDDRVLRIFIDHSKAAHDI